MSYGEAKVAMDAFFFDRYLHFQSKEPSMAHGLLTVLCVRRDIHDHSAGTSAPYMQQTLMHVHSVPKLV